MPKVLLEIEAAANHRCNYTDIKKLLKLWVYPKIRYEFQFQINITENCYWTRFVITELKLATLIHQTLHKSALLCNGFSSVSLGYNVCLMEVLRKALGCYKSPSLLFVRQLTAEICFSTKRTLSLSNEYMLTTLKWIGVVGRLLPNTYID